MATLTLTDAELEAIAAKVYAKMGTTPPVVTPAPPAPTPPPVIVPPAPAGISPRWDALGTGRQWAKWMFVTSAETVALQAKYDPTEVSRHINWYASYHRLDGRANPDGSYDYVDKYLMGSPVWVRDQNGSADARHLASLGAVPQIAPLG